MYYLYKKIHLAKNGGEFSNVIVFLKTHYTMTCKKNSSVVTFEKNYKTVTFEKYIYIRF